MYLSLSKESFWASFWDRE